MLAKFHIASLLLYSNQATTRSKVSKQTNNRTFEKSIIRIKYSVFDYSFLLIKYACTHSVTVSRNELRKKIDLCW